MLAVALVGCVEPPFIGSESDGRPGDGEVKEMAGGFDAKPDDFPATLKLIGGGQACTGAKVAPNEILTAAHCVVSGGSFNAGMGSQQYWVSSAPKPATQNDDNWIPVPSSNPRTGFVQIRIAAVYLDPAFAKTTELLKGIDFAVLVLAEESVPALAPVPIAPIDFNRVGPGTPFIYTGYGFDGSDAKWHEPSHLKYSRRKTIRPEESGIDNAAQFDKRYFLSFDEGDGQSHGGGGDSGAPLYHPDSNPPTIMGLVSAGISANGRDVSIFTRTGGFWLEKAIAGSADPAFLIPVDGGFGKSSCLGGEGFVGGAIKDKFKALGGCTSFLGVPKGNEQATKDGRYSIFEHGSIYWRADLGAHEVHGAIRAKNGPSLVARKAASATRPPTNTRCLAGVGATSSTVRSPGRRRPTQPLSRADERGGRSLSRLVRTVAHWREVVVFRVAALAKPRRPPERRPLGKDVEVCAARRCSLPTRHRCKKAVHHLGRLRCRPRALRSSGTDRDFYTRAAQASRAGNAPCSSRPGRAPPRAARAPRSAALDSAQRSARHHFGDQR